MEDKGFENFANQEKCKSVAELREKREKIANRVAGTAIVFLLLGITISCMEMDWLKTCVYDTTIGYSVKWSDIILVGSYVCTSFVSVVAILIGRTKLTKGFFSFLILFPISIILSVVAWFILFYVIFNPLVRLAWASM